MTDYDVLAALYRRATDATGKRPYLIVASRNLDGSVPFQFENTKDSAAGVRVLYGIPVVTVVDRLRPDVVVARVQVERIEHVQDKGASHPDFTVLDYCYQATLETRS